MAKTAPTALKSASKKATLPAGVTPMMAQYLAIKDDHPNCLLFYRMGDFYELFFDDAVSAAAALDITLTQRGKHQGEPIPMCGVPVHAADTYLSRLIKRGFRVAVCEQVEDPAEAKKRGAKSLVAREVRRVVTPGTITEEALLDAQSHNYLAALAEAGGKLGLAWLEISTGAFNVQSISQGALGAVLARLDPGEVLLSERTLQRTDLFEVLDDWKAVLTPQPSSRFDSNGARRRLEALFGVKALDGFGAFTRAEVAACGALVDYVELTQKGKLPYLTPPRRLSQGSSLEIDTATRRNLELTRTLSGERAGSLLAVMDRTVTGAGGRLLAEWLSAPLTNVAEITHRADGVQYFTDSAERRETVRQNLAAAPDVERALARLSVGRGGARDLAAVGDGLGRAGAFKHKLEEVADSGETLPLCLADIARDLGFHGELVDRLGRALASEPPFLLRDGGFIAAGYSPVLDELCLLRDESRRLIAGLQSKYAADTGIASLKIRHNNVLGYYVEVTPTQADNMPAGEDQPFIHRQTLASAVRYSTVELGDLEGRIRRAADQATALEMELFEDLRGEVTSRAEAVALAAASLAALDVLAALAALAVEQTYVRPAVDDSLEFHVTQGRHPVVEAAIEAARETAFVPNDCDLGPDRRLWLMTGPNMAGKSTFLRQNALIAVMAQMGSFVPAAAARIGVVDRLFSRVGAADDLARGRSTFMVEMVETAAILNQAGERTLIILDEIGRGTATYDGLSIAWATLEHIHQENRCRALFATHFHELTSLANRLEALVCHNMRVKEWQGDVVFLHEVASGAADRSYGIHVGRLAGLPALVLGRAEEVLAMLESGEQIGVVARLADDLPLFRSTSAAAPVEESSALAEALVEINADELTPKEALELLYRLKALV